MKKSRERFEPYIIGDLTEKEFEMFLSKTNYIKDLSKDDLDLLKKKIGLKISNLKKVDHLLKFYNFEKTIEHFIQN